MTRTILAILILCAPSTALAHGIHTNVDHDHGIGLATCIALAVSVFALAYLADRWAGRCNR